MTLLTTAEFRELSPSPLVEDALQLLLDAAEVEIVAYAGPVGARTELLGGGNRFVNLARPATSITSITETLWSTVETLDATDYLLYPDGYSIERLGTGTNGRFWWMGRVTVVYVPADDTAVRKAVQMDLVNLDINSNPGLNAETIGSWTQQFRASGTDDHDTILSRLSYSDGMIVVGDRGGYPLGRGIGW